MTGKNWIESMFEHARTIEDVAAQLHHLGRAYHRVGFYHVAEELDGLRTVLEDQSKKVRDLVGEKSQPDLEDATRASATIFASALAVARRKS